VIRQRDTLALSKTKEGWSWESAPYLIAAGDPPILQFRDTPSSYQYLWLRVGRTDDQGRAVLVRGWRVLCGPPSTPASGGKAAVYPGLTDANGNCVAASREALRAAAKSIEEDDATDVFDAHWVRDGDR
jgi:hypothetical protein